MTPLQQAMKIPPEQLTEGELRAVKVGVLDSGVDGAHPELLGRIKRAFVSTEHDDGSFVLIERSPQDNNDRYGHGTAVAGIIAATAPNTEIDDFCVIPASGVGSGEAMLTAFRAAIDGDARILNLSLACKAKFAAELNKLCETAYRRGKVVVAAKRNQPLVDLGFPAEFSSCISVDIATEGAFKNLSYLSQPPIEFAAAGADVPALAPGGLYTRVTGTSFATPAVAGICALLLGHVPQLSVFDLKALLRHFGRSVTKSARPAPAGTNGN